MEPVQGPLHVRVLASDQIRKVQWQLRNLGKVRLLNVFQPGTGQQLFALSLPSKQRRMDMLQRTCWTCWTTSKTTTLRVHTPWFFFSLITRTGRDIALCLFFCPLPPSPLPLPPCRFIRVAPSSGPRHPTAGRRDLPASRIRAHPLSSALIPRIPFCLFWSTVGPP